MARKKKQSVLNSLVKILLTLTAIFIIAYYVSAYFNAAPHIKYTAFGIDIPPGYEIHGIDVSRYQHIINWKDVKKMQVKNIKIGFAFIKATEGIDKVDEQFSRNWLAAEEAEMPKGAYHFFIAGKNGGAQANNFIEIAKLKTGDLPPVIDIEQTNNVAPDKILQEISEWLIKVEKYYSVKPIIYTNIDFYNRYIKNVFYNYPVWIAHYLQPEKPGIETEWKFWQHNEKGRVDGIKTPVDFDIFAGDSTDFQQLLMQQ